LFYSPTDWLFYFGIIIPFNARSKQFVSKLPMNRVVIEKYQKEKVYQEAEIREQRAKEELVPQFEARRAFPDGIGLFTNLPLQIRRCHRKINQVGTLCSL